MDTTHHQDSAASRQQVSQPPDALGRLLSDHEFEELLDRTLYNSPAKQRAMRRLRRQMDAQGRVTLGGGVRGWTDALCCGESRPKWILEGLAGSELIALDIVRDGGAGIAEIVVLGAFAPGDPSGIADPSGITTAAVDSTPHQDAENESSDPSGIDPPLASPHVESHDSQQQQQQHDRAHAREEAPNRPSDGEESLRSQWRKNAYVEFPRAERAAIDWLFDDRANHPPAIWRWLMAEPDLTLERARAKFGAAERRGDFERPRGAAIRAGQFDSEIGPARPRRLAERVAARRQESPPASPAEDRARPRGRRVDEGAIDVAEARAFFARRGMPVSPAPDEAAPAPQPAAHAPPARARPPAASPELPPARADPNLSRIWQATLGTIRQQTSRQEFDTWLRGTTLHSLEGSAAAVVVSSQTQREGLESRYLTPIRRALGDVVGYPVQVQIAVVT